MFIISLQSWADSTSLPEIGIVGSQALSIAQEKQYGDAYMRAMRASTQIVQDPLLENYINQLGHRLVAHADNVLLPFHFFLVNDSSINAAAFLGGYVKVNTGTVVMAQTQSQLASVMAHEISHVTQRHIARSLEKSAAASHLTLAGLLGSFIVAIANPMAGIAAMQTTMAASIQHQINYTRQNEYEADHIGMQVLHRSGFNPHAMVDFFSLLASKYRYSSKPPAWLVDHPLTSQRIADAQSRASQYPNKYIAPSLDFQMAKARIQVRFDDLDPDQAYSLFHNQLENHNYRLKDAALYGLTLALFAQKRYEKAHELIEKLAKKHPQSMYILDTQSDIDIAMKKTAKAVKRLQNAYQRYPDNRIVIINLAAAYMANKQDAKASQLLDRYLREHQNDLLGWQTLIEAYQHQHLTAKMQQARGEYFALRGQYTQGINELRNALRTTSNPLAKARIKARIKEFKASQKQLEQLQHL
ncbi:beta-barrel assembly-enhancing protease [Celerinatantimonas diazotrophica]|uniref:Putative beta-barrel assembly-enhancing protease n=1 Tax=Celerinatantimonas diazotrophica TaxID=412034 RepID=A0A4R1K4Q3_9GAMM|nr:M48 family metalloprotease [Celerinatantimonas diazotrophica]TCK58713.1 putative Zn-dependent protease [Celerinatantimonas diazotrophica]CAG9297344.1 Beta-barrel assembly-enhancing protease [Celerinatantimonas diazotrophica]